MNYENMNNIILPAMTTEVLDNLPFGAYIVNSLGVIEYFNPKMRLISGVDSEDDIVGENVFDLPSYKKYGLDKYMRAGLAGRPFHIEGIKYVSHKGGKESYRFYHGIPVKDNDGRVQKLLCIVEDKTEKNKVEKILYESEKKLRMIFDLSPIVIVLIDKKGVLLDINQKATEWLGYKRNEFIGKNIINLPGLNLENKAVIIKNFGKKILGKTVKPYDVKFKTKEGKIKIGRIAGSVFKDDRGKIIGDLVMISDVTNVAKKEVHSTIQNTDDQDNFLSISKDTAGQGEAEQALIKNDKQFRAIFKTMQDAIFIKDKELRYVQINLRAEKYLQLPSSKIINKTDKELFTPAQAEMSQIIDQRVLKGESIKEEITKNIQGKQINYYVAKTPLRNNAGKIIGICGVAHDITELKKIERRLKQEKEKFQIYLNLVGVMIIVLDKNAKITLINKIGSKILRSKKNEIIGKNWFDNFIPKEQRKSVKAVFAKLIAGEKKLVEYYENYIITKTGEKRLIAWHNIFLKNNEGKIIGILSSGDDITERKRMQEKYASSEQEWLETFNSMADSVSLHSSDFTIINVNQSLCNLLGKTKEELIGKKCFRIFHSKNKPIKKCPMLFTLKKKQEKRVEIFESKFNKWLSIYTSPILDEKGEITKIIHVVRDISERKKTEKEIVKRNQELEKFNKLMVGRELKMAELKKKNKKLEEKINSLQK